MRIIPDTNEIFFRHDNSFVYLYSLKSNISNLGAPLCPGATVTSPKKITALTIGAANEMPIDHALIRAFVDGALPGGRTREWSKN